MPHLDTPAAPRVPVGGSDQTSWLDELRAASDADLVARFTPGARAEAVNVLVSALVLPPDGPTGTVALVVRVPEGEETWTVRLDGDGAALAPGAVPDVELRLSLVSLVRLVTGQADGALLYLSGECLVTGDEGLVLALGGLLRAPGGTRSLIDPAALDPVAVSVAIKDVATAHLASVMAGGFRPLVLEQVFHRFPEFLIPEKAAGAKVTIGFAVGGRSDGRLDRYVVRVANGACVVERDTHADAKVDATLLLDGHEFLRLVLGHLNPVRGVLSGQLRVEGQVIKALGFNSIMRIPGS